MTTFRVDSKTDKSYVVSTKARLTLLKELKKTGDDYVKKERERLGNEAKALEAILKGRTGGGGVQSLNTQVASAVAKRDLADYLSPQGA